MSSRHTFSYLDLHLPTNGQPTEVLAFRFASWRKIIRALNIYLKEFASVQDEVYRQNARLAHSVNFPFFQYGTTSESNAAAAAADASKEFERQSLVYHTSNMNPEDEQTCRNFLPYGSNSLADLPATLLVYHNTQAEAAHRASKELVYNVIPRLEDLRRDLLVKIKEIKNLASDFKNSVNKEQVASHRELNAFVGSIEMLVDNSSALNAKNDPYLLKQSVGKQLARQINEENYLLEAYLNIQSSGKELERVVAQEVQSALNIFGKLVGQEAVNIEAFSSKVLNGYVQAAPVEEWDEFIKRDPNFVDPELKLRNIQDIIYPNMNSSLAYEIRSGYLERRSKYLKSYSRAWYVLTPAFLHEFKSSDRRKDPLPVMSISLSDCSLELDKKAASDSHKFILNTRISRSHKWVFRAESQEKLHDWYKDLTTLSAIESPAQRALKYFPSQEPIEQVAPPVQKQSPAPIFVPRHEAPVRSEVTLNNNFLTVQHQQGSSRSVSRHSHKSGRSTQIEVSVDPLDVKSPLLSTNSLAPTSPRNISRSVSPRLEEKPAIMLLNTPASPASPTVGHEGAPIFSDVFSETSEATSTGEPYGAGVIDGAHLVDSGANRGDDYDEDDDLERRKLNNRGRFGSEVLLNQFSKSEADGEEDAENGNGDDESIVPKPGSSGTVINGTGFTRTHPYRAQVEGEEDEDEDEESSAVGNEAPGTTSTLTAATVHPADV